jgi:hypothetical protein
MEAIVALAIPALAGALIGLAIGRCRRLPWAVGAAGATAAAIFAGGVWTDPGMWSGPGLAIMIGFVALLWLAGLAIGTAVVRTRRDPARAS